MKKLLFILLLLGSINSMATIRYVKVNAVGSNNGASWTNAYISLQSALDIAVSGDQIWVAAGTYLPSKDPFGNTSPVNPRDKTFYLISGVAMYGGFVGTETAINQRIKGINTILSADIGTVNNPSDNCYHVMLSINDANTTLIDNFTITDGYAKGTTSIVVDSKTIEQKAGAGLYNFSSNVSINNVIFQTNSAGYNANGLNSVGNGGAINNLDSSPTITNSIFNNNYGASGGAIANDNSSLSIANCVFNNNGCTYGTVYNANNSVVTITGTTFYKNSNYAIYNISSLTTVKNCIFWENYRFNAGGSTLVDFVSFNSSLSEPVIATITVSYSSMQSSLGVFTASAANYPNIGTSNNIFTQDPQFINSSNPIGVDNIWATADDGFELKGISPFLNLGTLIGASTTDITGKSRIGNPEMGAYEYNNTCSAFIGNIAYVNFAATGLNNGTSWTNAFTDLESAQYATRNCGVTQIWVAKGTYKPTHDPFSNPNPTDPRNKTFYLTSGVSIYGGFVGNETTINQRISSNRTLLSGDIGVVADTSDNCYHVVLSVNNPTTTSFDGFEIKYGNANTNGSINSLTIGTNSIYKSDGAGIATYNSSISFKNIVFSENNAIKGGGLFCDNGGTYNLSNVVFSENTGGGIYNTSSTITLNNAVFNSNSFGVYGGATISNSTFTRNRGGNSGGTTTNCIFWENYRALSISGLNNPGSDLGGGVVTNSSLQLINNSTNYPTANFPNLSTNNNLFAQDPQFVDVDNPTGPDGIWMTIDDGLALKSTSPCINTGTAIGSTLSDITGLGRTGNPEIGAYELNGNVYVPCPFTFTGGIAYVNAFAMGLNNGTNWANAYRNLESALKASRTCGVTQIWVAKGTYIPTKDPFGNIAPINHSNKTFYLTNGLALYGGFSGTETSINQRVKGNTTILFGYLGYDGLNYVSCNRVVLSVSDLASTIIDGFTITKGDAQNLYNPNDPGFFTIEAKIVNSFSGGGITNISSSPTISNIIFLSNFNGGLGNLDSSSPTITNCVFSKNGGAVLNIDSSPSFTNVVFSENISYARGAIYSSDYCNVTITNAVFYANATTNIVGLGAAILNKYNSNITLKNCSFWANAKVGNSTVVGADIENTNSSTANISYSSLQLINNATNYPSAGFPSIGTSNNLFALNPIFSNSTSPIGADNIWLTADDGLALQNTSPCIDAGTDTGASITDILGNSRAGLADIGAYEFQTPSSIYETTTTGNFNANATWNTNTPPTATKTAKINSTHTVNIPNAGNHVKTIIMNGGNINLTGGTLEIKNQ
jgi:hypothetical protein